MLAVRSAVGQDIKLMVDFNQGLSLGDALHRCHALDGQGLYRLEEPITYTNLAGYAQLQSRRCARRWCSSIGANYKHWGDCCLMSSNG